MKEEICYERLVILTIIFSPISKKAEFGTNHLSGVMEASDGASDSTATTRLSVFIRGCFSMPLETIIKTVYTYLLPYFEARQLSITVR